MVLVVRRSYIPPKYIVLGLRRGNLGEGWIIVRVGVSRVGL